ncbi:SDR family NAD(P)-dependent oxidoreductase [Streptomyces candidus]|uniref:NAD(P)-dependent dehydrogenase (Short-subunit alcohol dehydrogenase family) n=1 Tax=Streptomyces candidus TaxID=67283 RepID=A0A7X0HFI7_9ACTN|nr:SDR family oxidoreductase [Streptomyces candidus]MBB6436697.1 NAD(P)-dependent dehydrogenase (short-subunit alcohol dehydrogenase family) [Streptomyces candidus]GHH51108.1 ketoreductase [Streptomyces candidus]
MTSQPATQPFADQTVVVTGGGTGIGRATALAFAAGGARTVIITGRRKERLDEVAELHTALVPLPADVTSGEGADAVADAVRTYGGALDVLVHNAGVFRPSPLTAWDPAAAQQVLATNVLGLALLTTRLLPQLRSPGGRLVLVSSRGGHNPGPESSLYCASKAAVHSFCRSWAAELAPRGIRVNAVAPGFVRTEAYVAGGLAPEQAEGLLAGVAHAIPLGRVAEADEVARWILYLADPASAQVTGQIVTIDGGLDVAHT